MRLQEGPHGALSKTHDWLEKPGDKLSRVSAFLCFSFPESMKMRGVSIKRPKSVNLVHASHTAVAQHPSGQLVCGEISRQCPAVSSNTATMIS